MNIIWEATIKINKNKQQKIHFVVVKHEKIHKSVFRNLNCIAKKYIFFPMYRFTAVVPWSHVRFIGFYATSESWWEQE